MLCYVMLCQYNITKPTTCSIGLFAESLVDISPGTPVKTTHTCTHPPPANTPQDLKGYWIKVHEFFFRQESSAVLMQ